MKKQSLFLILGLGISTSLILNISDVKGQVLPNPSLQTANWLVESDSEALTGDRVNFIGPNGDNLFQQIFLFRTDEERYGGREFRINELGVASAERISDTVFRTVYGGDSIGVLGNPDSDPLRIIRTTTLDEIDARNAVLRDELVFENRLDRERLDFDFFLYTDFDISGSFGNDFVTGIANNSITQSDPDGTRAITRTVSGQNPNDFALESYPILLDALTDNSPTELAPFGNQGFQGDVTHAFQWGITLPGEFPGPSSQRIVIENEIILPEATGSTQNNPFITDPDQNGGFAFGNARSGRWWDPPFAETFDYQITTPGSLFTAVGLPTGINDPTELFNIIVNGAIIAQIEGGGIYDFTTNVLFPDGVEEFSIGGISPSSDPVGVDVGAGIGDPFPTQLFFNLPDGNGFVMTPVTDIEVTTPEPYSLASLFVLGLGLLVSGKKRRDAKPIYKMTFISRVTTTKEDAPQSPTLI